MKLVNILKKIAGKAGEKTMENCSFCERSRLHVQLLLNYKNAYICENCVRDAVETMQQNGFLTDYVKQENQYS